MIASELADGDTYLRPTPYIDTAAAPIVAATARVIAGAATPRERAVRIHDFVRDQVRFGFAGAFYDMPASAVLAAGRGFCNTKSTLFVAMLRAAGIPARQHFVDIDVRILDGVVDPGTPYVDHSYTEVFLDGRWVRTDSYIVDCRLFERAQARLAAEGRALGYGVHADGTPDWDGEQDAFVQFVQDGRVATLSTRDYGVHADVGALYATAATWNRLPALVRLVFPIFAWSANRRTDALRGS